MMSKDAYYFSHDSNARYDPKILAMRAVYGMEGYGRYWCLIEILRDEDGYKLEKTKHLFDALAMQMQCERNAAHEFVDACINEFGLLREDDEYIWSDSLINRMENKDKKSEKARKAAQKRWQKSSNDAGSMHSECERNADAMQTHSKRNALKERKVKESKEKEKHATRAGACEAAASSELESESVKFFVQNFGSMNPNDADLIADWEIALSTELVIAAMKLVISKGSRSIKFIDKVCRDWQKAGVTSLEEAQELERRHSPHQPRDGNIVPIGKKKQEEYKQKYGF
ncbi:DUF4373 domain-containing protein [Sporolactobacillus sp. THM7-7]|nr:DUF4373 domain-containing protein [Sporolactobacillus sp. THM7-7]